MAKERSSWRWSWWAVRVCIQDDCARQCPAARLSGCPTVLAVVLHAVSFAAAPCDCALKSNTATATGYPLLGEHGIQIRNVWAAVEFVYDKERRDLGKDLCWNFEAAELKAGYLLFQHILFWLEPACSIPLVCLCGGFCLSFAISLYSFLPPVPPLLTAFVCTRAAATTTR